MKEAQNTAASLTTFNEVDLFALQELRARLKEDFVKKHGVKLGYMGPFVKAAATALQEIPIINARVENGDTIVYNHSVDISVAVATPKGLVTPVLRACHLMSIADIERTIGELGERARDNKISINELTGGTFTISNGGVFGSMMGTPILNSPQSAILGMHAIKERAVVLPGTGEIVARPMMYLALTYDHRIIDGREAVTFLVRVKQLLEDPCRLLLGV
jgi:2-oxoglutarate dehydrogenase E2 component (dihydrolipoamide succinyltransferase)